MKKELKNKLIFISGVVFALALLFVSVQMIQAGWTAPTAPFPGGTVYPPIDSGPDPKQGELIIRSGGLSLEGKVFENSGSIVSGTGKVLEIPKDRWINAENNIFVLKNTEGNIVFSSPSGGQFLVNTNGIVLPSKDSTQEASIIKKSGTVYYNTTKKGVKLYDGSNWVDIGSGGGDSVWTKVESGAFFDGNATLGTMADQGGYEPTGKVFTVDSKTLNSLDQKEFAFINKVSAAPDYENNRLLECDKSDVQEECFGFVVVSGHHAIGDLKYDRYMDYGEPGIKSGLTKVSYKELEYKIKPAVINSTGVLYTKDIDLSQPAYSHKTNDIEVSGGSQKSMDEYIEGWVECPYGYFMTGFRFGRNVDNDLKPIIRCAKL